MLTKLCQRRSVRRVGQFCPIPVGELGKAPRVVAIPAPQLVRGGDVGHPGVQGCGVLAQSARPQSVDQQASAVGRVRIVVDPLHAHQSRVSPLSMASDVIMTSGPRQM
jgi:hypothetical protein